MTRVSCSESGSISGLLAGALVGCRNRRNRKIENRPPLRQAFHRPPETSASTRQAHVTAAGADPASLLSAILAFALGTGLLAREVEEGARAAALAPRRDADVVLRRVGRR